MEFTSESLSDLGEEPSYVGVACPPGDARARLTRHGAETLAPTGHQARADEAGGFLVPLLLLFVVVVGGR